ncbi:MAG TPA: hypothetical protein PLP99_06380 [Ignavibacteriales bacterium]|nr:hypothetical protein [Ignavibacteriales bacterium]HOL81367.1 hypothetical protein [Ignavibacteriales bacterium]HOM65482.1 hypothetical protein [Ignavibacteriales bacterium]HPP33864.1 hypothetical protein [Ignavibacteriales bacterium]HRT98312.1 hypothetical protein [Ignavibacteriales bacterium]
MKDKLYDHNLSFLLPIILFSKFKTKVKPILFTFLSNPFNTSFISFINKFLLSSSSRNFFKASKNAVSLLRFLSFLPASIKLLQTFLIAFIFFSLSPGLVVKVKSPRLALPFL